MSTRSWTTGPAVRAAERPAGIIALAVFVALLAIAAVLDTPPPQAAGEAARPEAAAPAFIPDWRGNSGRVAPAL